jgi:hypothetical protein
MSVIISPLSMLLSLFGRTIMQVWTHGSISYEPTLFALLLLVVVCNRFWSTSYVTLIAVN